MFINHDLFTVHLSNTTEQSFIRKLNIRHLPLRRIRRRALPFATAASIVNAVSAARAITATVTALFPCHWSVVPPPLRRTRRRAFPSLIHLIHRSLQVRTHLTI